MRCFLIGASGGGAWMPLKSGGGGGGTYEGSFITGAVPRKSLFLEEASFNTRLSAWSTCSGLKLPIMSAMSQLVVMTALCMAVSPAAFWISLSIPCCKRRNAHMVELEEAEACRGVLPPRFVKLMRAPYCNKASTMAGLLLRQAWCNSVF
eukprot:Lithocolla_globosa_v1_NODE_4859_length_1350_cov_79.130502.p2 type:complete len:150 gc:universal NODE_4859_length_1350_cov_79.130502:104-553(+)